MAKDRLGPAQLIFGEGQVGRASTIGDYLAAKLCPKANPLERAFGDVHDKCRRNHKRTRIDDLSGDVAWHLRGDGSWPYQLAHIYYTPEVDAAVAALNMAQELKAA